MKIREGTTSVVRIQPQRGEGRLAGGERSGPPARRRITICTPAGVAGPPRAPAGARWSRRHGFQGFAKGAHPWLSSQAPFQGARAYLEKYVTVSMKSCTKLVDICKFLGVQNRPEQILECLLR